MFEWRTELELGIDSIDSQHKKLITFADQIYRMAQQEASQTDDEILLVLNELKDYTIYHFKTEEELFLKYRFPEYETHKLEHDNFRQYIAAFQLEEAGHSRQEKINELLVSIVKWIIKHIIDSDYWYKDYLINLGVK